jgi:hypothetical protein
MGRTKSSTSSAAADIARYAPAIILAASSCTLVSAVLTLLVCPFSPDGVYHTEHPYVICDRTMAEYTRRSAVKLEPHVDPARDLSAIIVGVAFP